MLVVGGRSEQVPPTPEHRVQSIEHKARIWFLHLQHAYTYMSAAALFQHSRTRI